MGVNVNAGGWWQRGRRIKSRSKLMERKEIMCYEDMQTIRAHVNGVEREEL